MRTIPTVVFVFISFAIGECAAQVTDGQHNGMQSLLSARSATNSGSVALDVAGTSTSSTSDPAKALTAAASI